MAIGYLKTTNLFGNTKYLSEPEPGQLIPINLV